jgi:hypothetical protein
VRAGAPGCRAGGVVQEAEGRGVGGRRSMRGDEEVARELYAPISSMHAGGRVAYLQGDCEGFEQELARRVAKLCFSAIAPGGRFSRTRWNLRSSDSCALSTVGRGQVASSQGRMMLKLSLTSSRGLSGSNVSWPTEM